MTSPVTSTHDEQAELLHEALGRAAERWGDAPLIEFLDHGASYPLSYARLAADSRALAVHLLQVGMHPNDRVALMMSNRAEFLTIWFACAYAGLVCVPVNTAMRGNLLDHVLRSTTPRLAFVERENLDVFAAAAESQELHIRLVVVGTAGSILQTDLPVVVNTSAAQILPSPRPSDSHSIFFTSGTTGPAKGVIYSHARTMHLARNSNEWLQTRSEDTVYTCLPLFHINALLNSFLNCLRVGGKIVISKRFSARNFWHEVRESEATIVNCLGTMAAILWKRDPSDMDRDHHVQRGLVMPCPVDWDDWHDRFGFEVLQCYGSTDAGSIIGAPVSPDRRTGAAGKLLEGWEAVIADDADNPLPTGTAGELLVRPTLPHIAMDGYWDQPGATVNAWRNLWIHTGDILTVDEDGWFWFVSRKAEFIRRSGENISCFEVEQTILRHSALELVLAFGVPSDMGDDDVAVIVEPRLGHTVDAAELRIFCVEHLPRYGVPRYVGVATRLPLTESGKVDRATAIRDLRHLLVDFAP
jgi:crotonobetaine/carnitine-CoA ligase